MKKIVFLFVILPLISFSQKTKTEKIEALFDYVNNNYGFSGSILITHKNEIIFEKSYGFSNYDLKIENTSYKAFDVASSIKPLTALGILILYENNKLSLEDNLSNIFPGFPKVGIQIKHLLTHTSGLPDYTHNTEFSLYLDNVIKSDTSYEVSNIDLINYYTERNIKLSSIPGEKFSYCNAGYVILAAIIEKISGIPFYDFLRKEILYPASMSYSFLYDQMDSVNKEKIAIAYEKTMDGKGRKEVKSYHKKYPGEGFKGDGGLYSTAIDLNKLLDALYNEKIISKETLKEATTGFKLKSGKKCPYGYGWIVRNDGYENRPFTIKHGGKWEGFLTAFACEPDNKNIIIILTNNSMFPPTIGDIEASISQILNNKKYDLPRFPIRDTIAHTILAEGIEEGIQLYKNLKRNSFNKFYFDMHQLNLLGYMLLWNNKKEEALEILKLNAEEYPDHWNSYDSLGDIYKEIGDFENAIIAYNKALVLNPERKQTKEKLNILQENNNLPQY